MKLTKYKIKDIAKTSSGGTPKSTIREYYENGTIPWINSGELSQSFITETSNYITELGYKNSSAKIFPKEETVLLAMYGATAGKASLLQIDACTNQAICAIMPDKKVVEPLFLKYKLDTMYKYLVGLSTGSARDNLSQAGIGDIEIELPDLDTQRRIASVLSNLDRKIALNRQINTNLEALARQLYDYWFVQFDFPDANGKPYKSSGGKMVYNEQLKREIPKGWEVKQMDEVIEIRSGFPFQSSTYLPKGKYRIITIKNVQDGYLDINDTDFIEELPKRIPDYCILKKGDTLVSLTGNIGRVGRVYTTNLLLNQRVGFVDSKIGFTNWAYLFLTTTQIRQQIEKLGIGSAQSNVSPIQIGKIKMVLPPLALLSNFEQRVAPMLNQIISNSEENSSLTRQRDELLPLLMNGQVSVE